MLIENRLHPIWTTTLSRLLPFTKFVKSLLALCLSHLRPIRVVTEPATIQLCALSSKLEHDHRGQLQKLWHSQERPHRERMTSMNYLPLAIAEFRLLQILPQSTSNRIHGVLSHHQFPSNEQSEPCVKYVALSYCWGSPLLTGSITLNGCPFAVTGNLFQALQDIICHHLPSRRTLFWIDAVCINQSDTEEKAEQVRQMWRIFENASVVYAWLGWQGRDVHVLDESRRLHGDGPDPSQERIFSDVNVALLNLSRRDYFTRTWTRPEFLRARVLLLIAGSFSFNWDWIMRRIEDWPKRRKHEALPANGYQLFLSRSHPRSMRNEPHDGEPSLPHQRFTNMLRLYSQTSCTDPRDRIYSMLSDPGWVKLQYAIWWIQPDYRLSHEELALLVLAYYDYLVKWDFRRRTAVPLVRHEVVCDHIIKALDTSRTKVRSLALKLAQRQDVSRPERLVVGYGFEVECVGPVLGCLWSGKGFWQERPG